MIRKAIRFLAIFLLVGLALLLLIPLIFSYPQLLDVRDPQELGDSDSKFVEVDGVRLHYQQHGSGKPVMILLHGFAASTYSFREIVEPLSQLGTVIA